MKHEYSLIIRVLIAVFVALFYNYLYLIFTPISVYSSWFLLKILGYEAIIHGSKLSINGAQFIFVEACIALAAYYLLLLLILFTKDLSLKMSAKLFLLGSLLILIMNIIRIDLLVVLFIEAGKRYFDIVHLAFWKFIAGIYVALVWILLVRKYNVKSIPIYSDLKELYKKTIFRTKKKKRKR